VCAAEDGPRWDAEVMREASAAVRAVIERKFPTAGDLRRLRANGRLASAPSPHGVFVTVFHGDGRRGRGFSDSGADTLEKLVNAASTARLREAGASGEFHIQIDVPGRSRVIAERPLFHLLSAAYRDIGKFGLVGRYGRVCYELEPGIDGLVLEDGAGPIVALPSDPITEGWLTPTPAGGDPGKSRAILRNAWVAHRGRPFDFSADAVAVSKLRTFAFAERAPHAEPVALLRASPDEPAELTRDELVRRTILAADWLGRQVGEGGRFRYETMPPKSRSSNDYAFARHAGGAYALMAFHRASLDRSELRAAGERALRAALLAISFVKTHAVDPDPADAVDELCFTDPKTGTATSGGTALAALAFALLPEPEAIGDPSQRAAVMAFAGEDLLNRLDACVLGMIDPDGAVFANRGEAARARFVTEEHRFFAGEVMLSLTYAYERTRDRRLLDAAKRIGDRQLARSPWPASWGLPAEGDHWVTQAASRLAILAGDTRYAELSVSFGRGFLRDQVPPGSYLHGDYRGAYKRVGMPGTTLTASAGEAVGAAMRAARFLGRGAGEFEEALIEGAQHLARVQFTEQGGHWVPDGFDVAGAVRMGIASGHCRIDNNQHAIVAFLAALEAMDARAAAR